MNKKVNTLLFILGATVVNVIMMMVIFLGVFVLYGKFLAPQIASQTVNQVMMIVIFIGAIVLTYFIYHRLIKYLTHKIDMDKYFDPIFRSRSKK